MVFGSVMHVLAQLAGHAGSFPDFTLIATLHAMRACMQFTPH
jgi:hypothetical protein